MALNDLFLTKEEIPIFGGRCFHMPIHPALLDQSIQLDWGLAKKVFPQAAKEWYEDMKKYAETQHSKKEILNFISGGPTVKTVGDEQSICGIRDEVRIAQNGFAKVLATGTNTGTLYYMPGDDSCRFSSSGPGNFLALSVEKLKLFGEEVIPGCFELKTYGHHNVSVYHDALFLRNWAILYQNEALKQLFS